MSRYKPKTRRVLEILNEIEPAEDIPVNLSPKDAAMFADLPEEEYGCPTDRKLPRCETQDKVCFPSRNSAKNALRLRQRRGAGFLRVYQCDHCHAYHLTSLRPGK